MAQVLRTHYVPGSTLYRLIARFSGRVPEAWVRFYATELVLGLEHVHACGLIHRFLAPENILISKTGHLRLSCFGSSSLAPFVPHQAPDDIQTLCARYNTLYMAPEMLRKVGYGQSVDWWAVRRSITFRAHRQPHALTRPSARPMQRSSLARSLNS